MADTKTKNRNEDESGSPETCDLSNGIQSYETWDEMLDSWEERAKALATEMRGFGFASIWLTAAYDKMDGELTGFRTVRMGNYYTCLGMMRDSEHLLLNGEL